MTNLGQNPKYCNYAKGGISGFALNYILICVKRVPQDSLHKYGTQYVKPIICLGHLIEYRNTIYMLVLQD